MASYGFGQEYVQFTEELVGFTPDMIQQQGSGNNTCPDISYTGLKIMVLNL
jgi:hypothetical protein